MRVLVSGYHGMGNLGDEAVLAAFVQHLKGIDPGATCVALSGEPTETSAAYGIEAVPRASLGAIIRQVRRADIVVSGGGSLLQDVTGRKSVPYYLGIIILACMMKRPVSIYAQGLGPLNHAFSRWLVKRILSRTSVITVRDEGSARLLHELGVLKPEPVVVADPAFALTPRKPDESITVRGPNTVMFCFRPWPGTCDREAEYAECIDRAVLDLGITPVFLAFHPHQDVEISLRIAERCTAGGKKPAVIPCDMPPQEALGLISRAEMVVGMRLHSLIFAATTGVPAVAIDYDPKIRAHCRLIAEPHIVEAGAPADELYAAIASAWASRNETKARLRRIMPQVRERAEAGARIALAPIVDEPWEANGGCDTREGKDFGRASVLGSPVDCISMDDAVAFLMERAASGVGAHVVTINPEMTLAATHDSELADVISKADLVVPDGVGVVRGLRILGYEPPGRVPGIELAIGLMRSAARCGMPFFLVGAEPGVADAAAERMARDMPGLKVAGTFHGYFREAEEEDVLSRIQDADPSFVLVGMGGGKQEKWIVKARKSAPSAVWIGVGGSFDVMSGNVKRAPVAFQKLGLEWFYRLITEPRRAKRMTALPAFVFAVLGEAFRKRRRS
jgi:polysaccharide pyruvyl transferase CsaB